MEMSGDQWVPLGRDEVWKALNDPHVLQECIPGCESVEQKSDTEFAATVTAKVGQIKSRFKGDMNLSDLDPPSSYKLNFQGQGAAGFTKGSASVNLVDESEGTRIQYNADANIGGKLARVGARLIDGAARKMANEFFTNLTEYLGGSAKPAGEQGSQASGNPSSAGESNASGGQSSAGGQSAPAEGGGLLARIIAAIKRLFAGS
jgi:carbon monoxide dehydrogenase subunit G